MQGQGDLVLVDQQVDGAGLVVAVADPADAPHALARAGHRQALLDARIAEDALLGLRDALVEVDLLVRTGGDAVAIAPAALLVDQHDAVLLALVDGVARARREAGGVVAVVADPRQVEVVAVRVVAGALVLVPVRAPGGLHVRPHPRVGAGHQALLEVVLPGDAVVLGARLAADLQIARLVEPAAHRLVVARVAAARLGLDVVPVHVLPAVAVGPLHLAGRRARMAADALVEIHHHAELPLDPGCHFVRPLNARFVS